MAKKKDKFYVSNKKFTESVAEYSRQYKIAYDEMKKEYDDSIALAKEQGVYNPDDFKKFQVDYDRIPPMSDYIGSCIKKIAYGLSYHRNFIGYTDDWKKEMVGDGIYNAVKYIKGFDPEKSDNAFAYASQIIWNAFLRRIKAEKKQGVIKQKHIERIGIIDEYSHRQSHDNRIYQNAYVDNLNNNSDDFYGD